MDTKAILKIMAVAALMLGASLSSSAAFAAPGVQLTNTVMRNVEQKGADGRVTQSKVAATSVAPGEQVTYVIAYKNDAAKPAERVVVTNPVPVNLEFVSASDGAEVSVDGGKSYGALASLTTRSASGAARAAQAADVTNVRWRIANAIAPGAAGEVSFQAKVK